MYSQLEYSGYSDDVIMTWDVPSWSLPPPIPYQLTSESRGIQATYNHVPGHPSQ